MQLEISGYAARLALYLREPAQVTADELNAFSYALAALAFDVQQLVVKSGANDMAADGASFFVLKDDYVQRVAQLRAALIQNLSNFNGRKRSNVAIVIATFRHRINMRPDQQRLERWITAGARANDVSC